MKWYKYDGSWEPLQEGEGKVAYLIKHHIIKT